MADDPDSARSIRVKRIAVQSRVSGKFGDYIENDIPGRRRKRARIFGTILSAIDAKKYRVLFDNGNEIDCYSNSLRVETDASLPPDLVPNHPPALPPPVGNEAVNAPTIPDDDDHSLGEHLPVQNPDEDELSEAESLPDQPQENQELPVGALPTADQVEAPSYTQQRSMARDRIRQMVGTSVREKSGNTSVLWTVIDNHVPDDVIPRRFVDSPIGWKDTSTLKNQPRNMMLAYLFFELMFKDKQAFRESVDKMNDHIRSCRESKVKLFTPEEFLICLGVMIGVSEFEQQGRKCWSSSDHGGEAIDDEFHSLVQPPNFDRFISFTRFKDFRRFVPSIYVDEENQANDPWWRFCSCIDNFNEIRRRKLCKGPWAVIDESMSAWRPRTTQLGGLPNISHVPRKPEPLGTEFKCTADPLTGCMLALEIQRGKRGMENREFNNTCGNTGGCTIRLMNVTNSDNTCIGVKGDAWFGSVKNCSNLVEYKSFSRVITITLL